MLFDAYVGTLVATQAGNISNCKVVGESSVIGNNYVGGLVGSGSGKITGSSNKADVTGVSYVGGLVGNGYHYITQCYSDATIKGTSDVGGLVGNLKAAQYIASYVKESYSAGKVEGERGNIGGLIGYVEGYQYKSGRSYYYVNSTIENCMSLADVKQSGSSYSYVGGLIGRGYGRGSRSSEGIKVTKCYVAGNVEYETGVKGGLVGSPGRVIIGLSYHDGVLTGVSDVYSKLTTGLHHQAGYKNYDFDTIWALSDGESYSYLKNVDKPQAVYRSIPLTDIDGGNGSKESPYLIKTKSQLNQMRYDLTGHYQLGADIDLSGLAWEPIGSSQNKFLGSLDGNGYVIKNLSIDKSEKDYIGFISYLQGDLKNVVIENSSVKGRNTVGT